MYFVKFAMLFFLSILSGCKSDVSQRDKHFNPKIEAKMNELLVENKIPGINFSIIYENEKRENYAVGYAHVEKKIALKQTDILLSGSIGKTYATALILQLVDLNQIRLKDKFIDHFQDIDWISKIPNIEFITLEMLLMHTSGLPRWVMKPEVWQTLNASPDKIWSYEDRLAYIFGEESVHPPGEGWSYSDTNYLLIGMLIEKLTDKNYYDVVRDKILSPHNLKETLPSNKRIIPNLAMGYSALPHHFLIPEEVLSEGEYVFNPQMEWTGGGMASTTADLAKWSKVYFEGSAFSKKILKSVVAINENGHEAIGVHSYGMGSFIYKTKHGDAFGHSGFMPGYNSIFAYYPKQKIAVALQINCDYATKNMKLVEYLDELMEIALND